MTHVFSHVNLFFSMATTPRSPLGQDVCCVGHSGGFSSLEPEPRVMMVKPQEESGTFWVRKISGLFGGRSIHVKSCYYYNWLVVWNMNGFLFHILGIS